MNTIICICLIILILYSIIKIYEKYVCRRINPNLKHDSIFKFQIPLLKAHDTWKSLGNPDLFITFLGKTPMVTTANVEIAKEILLHRETFQKQGTFPIPLAQEFSGKNLFLIGDEDEDWSKYRKIFNPSFVRY
jgi:cytochrome P450